MLPIHDCGYIRPGLVAARREARQPVRIDRRTRSLHSGRLFYVTDWLFVRVIEGLCPHEDSPFPCMTNARASRTHPLLLRVDRCRKLTTGRPFTVNRVWRRSASNPHAEQQAASPTGHTTRQVSQALGHNFSYLLASRPGAGDAAGIREALRLSP